MTLHVSGTTKSPGCAPLGSAALHAQYSPASRRASLLFWRPNARRWRSVTRTLLQWRTPLSENCNLGCFGNAIDGQGGYAHRGALGSRWGRHDTGGVASQATSNFSRTLLSYLLICPSFRRRALLPIFLPLALLPFLSCVKSLIHPTPVNTSQSFSANGLSASHHLLSISPHWLFSAYPHWPLLLRHEWSRRLALRLGDG